MSKKINKKFLKLYVELDNLCCDVLGVKAGGVTEYINRLETAKFAPKRDEQLDRYNKYRNIRNILSNNSKELKKNKILVKSDLKWIKKENKTLKKRKDSVSRYLKKARKFARNRKIKRTSIFLAIVGGGAAAAILLTK